MSFESALSDYRPSAGDDIQIRLPPRREPKQKAEEVAEQLELGQHGGAGEAAGSTAEAHAAVASSTSSAPVEPVPERDQPDEGEHTDSTEEQVAARAKTPEPEPDEPAEAPEAAAPAEDATEPPAASSRPVSLSEFGGSAPVAYKRVGFSPGADVQTVVVKPFPQPLVDKLRLLLAERAGGEFATEISNGALLTAYLMATIGVDLDADENTMAAAEAFRWSETRVAGIEDRVDAIADDLTTALGDIGRVLKHVRQTAAVTESIEFSTAYLVTDRVAGLSTAETDETNVDITHRKVLTARDTIRRGAHEQTKIEREREGRNLG